jgi:hypothetical protein
MTTDDPIEFGYRTRQTTLDGEPVLIVETDIPDGAPQAVKEGLARRAAVNAGGVCPCGARAVIPDRAARRRAARLRQLITVTVQHEDDCLALLPGYLPMDLDPEPPGLDQFRQAIKTAANAALDSDAPIVLGRSVRVFRLPGVDLEEEAS